MSAGPKLTASQADAHNADHVTEFPSNSSADLRSQQQIISKLSKKLKESKKEVERQAADVRKLFSFSTAAIRELVDTELKLEAVQAEKMRLEETSGALRDDNRSLVTENDKLQRKITLLLSHRRRSIRKASSSSSRSQLQIRRGPEVFTYTSVDDATQIRIEPISSGLGVGVGSHVRTDDETAMDRIKTENSSPESDPDPEEETTLESDNGNESNNEGCVNCLGPHLWHQCTICDNEYGTEM